MKLHSVVPMKVAKYGYIAISIVFCLAGVTLLALPEPPVTAIGLFFGVSLLVFGVIKLIGYFSKDLFRLAFQYDLQFGILLMTLGIITLLRPAAAVEFICIAYGLCMIADGLFKGKTALEAKRFGIRRWWLTMLLAALAALAGLLVLLSPVLLLRAVNVLLGLSLLVEGVLNLSVAISMVKIIDHQRPDAIDVDYYEVE